MTSLHLQRAFRRIRQNPVYAVTIVLCLALGIGANTAIFSLVNMLVLQPLPVEEVAGDGELSERTWGERNRIQPHHVFSLVAPPLGRWLDPPAQPMAGWYHMPLLQTPGFGPTVRLVVSPGREEEGLFQMPGGQSGNPRSPHYADLHDGWVRGESVPLLPGPPQDVLTPTPTAAGRVSP